LPSWANEMCDLFRSGSTAQFILHGNVFDVIPAELSKGPAALSVQEYLQEVLDNLVSNALKFMAPGPPQRSVNLRLSSEEGFGIVEVSDEGPGFTEEDQAHVFGRFSKLSARPTGDESSNGLGLSIVRRLVEGMHGRVELESILGQGARFRVILPLAPEAPTFD